MRERTATRLRGLLILLEAAVLVNDETIMTDGLTWWRRRMRALQVSADAFLDAALDALAARVRSGSVPIGAVACPLRHALVTFGSTPEPVNKEIARFTSYGR